MSKRSVVLTSGGMDSAVALWAEHAAGRDPIAFSVFYGQRHVCEVHYAFRQAVRLHAPFERIWLEGIAKQFRSALLGQQPGELEGAATIVPARNTLLISLAAGYAESHGCEWVVIGCNADDAAVYPDCRMEFLAAMAEVVRLGSEGRVRLSYPLVSLTKAEIVRRGNALGVPWELTWSCYAGGTEPCGACGACKSRQAALAAAGLAVL